MFAVIEFGEKDGGGLAVINTGWLTPRKKEVFWPPTKDSKQFQKLVCSVEEDCINRETWSSYEVHRVFYECDDYEKATKKLKLAEVTSELNTDTEENHCRKRKVIPTRRILDSSSEEDETTKFERPPKMKLKFQKSADNPRTTGINSATPIAIRPIGTSSCGAGPSNDDILLTPRHYSTPIGLRGIGASNSGVNSLHLDQPVLAKVLEKLVRIEVQNEQILNLLQHRRDANMNPNIPTSLPTLPVNLPLQSVEDILEVEEYLANENDFHLMKTYLASLGGNTITTRTNHMLRQLLTNLVASSYSFFGRKKQDFHILRLSKLVISAMKIGSPQSTEKEVEDVIKVWLKHAPERLKTKDRDIVANN